MIALFINPHLTIAERRRAFERYLKSQGMTRKQIAESIAYIKKVLK